MKAKIYDDEALAKLRVEHADCINCPIARLLATHDRLRVVCIENADGEKEMSDAVYKYRDECAALQKQLDQAGIDHRELISAAKSAIPESEYPADPTSHNWSWQIRVLGDDRRAAYRETERLEKERDKSRETAKREAQRATSIEAKHRKSQRERLAFKNQLAAVEVRAANAEAAQKPMPLRTNDLVFQAQLEEIFSGYVPVDSERAGLVKKILRLLNGL